MSDETATIEQPNTTQGTATQGTGEGGFSSAPETPSIFSDGFNFAPGFTDQLTGNEWDELRPTLGKFKSLHDLGKSYLEAQRTISQRQEGMVKVPGQEATPDEIAAFRRAIGAPEAPDGYKLDGIKLPEGIELQDDLLTPFREFALKEGIPAATFAKLIEFHADFESRKLAEVNAQFEDMQKSGADELRKEWGPRFEQRSMLANRAAATFDIPEDHPAMKDPTILRALARVAEGMSEDKLAGNDAVARTLSSGNQARDILFNPQNQWHNAYHNKDENGNSISHPMHNEAVAHYNRLLAEQVRREGY